MGYIFSLMFYVLLVLAALTSTISLHEVATAYLHERFKLSRKKAATVVTLVCMTLGDLRFVFRAVERNPFGRNDYFDLSILSQPS